jgi:hypothetical protein
MTIGRDLLTKAETVMVAAIEAGVPTLVEAREIITQFHLMIRRRLETGLTPWIERARASLIASFASGVARDEAAVRPAITSPWFNGQTEGQITRLKLVRRQMCHRSPSRNNRSSKSCVRRCRLAKLYLAPDRAADARAVSPLGECFSSISEFLDEM